MTEYVSDQHNNIDNNSNINSLNVQDNSSIVIKLFLGFRFLRYLNPFTYLRPSVFNLFGSNEQISNQNTNQNPIN